MAKRKSIGIGKGFYYYYDTLSPMESFYAKGKKKPKPVKVQTELEKLLDYFNF